MCGENDCVRGQLLITFFRPRLRAAGNLYRTGRRLLQAFPPFLETNSIVCGIGEFRPLMADQGQVSPSTACEGFVVLGNEQLVRRN
jgi:hypothetical protein